MQSIDYTMTAASSPSFGDPHAAATTPGAGATLSSLQDFLASQHMSGTVQTPSGDFADLLAEFTLPNTALSPETLGKSPEPFGAGDMEGIAFGSSMGSATRQREKSAQEVLLEQLGFPVSQLAPNLGQGGATSSKEQVNQALASLDAGTRAQLLNALLTLKQQQTSGSPTASNPSPRAASALSPHTLNSPRYHEQPSQGSPLAYSSQPPSQHNSPQPFQAYNSPVPHPLQQQHGPHSQAPYQPLPAALAASLPPSAVSSPVGSPYIQATNSGNYYGPSPAPQVPTSPFIPASYHNAFSPRPFDAAQQSQSPAVQAQLAMDMFARVNGQGVPDMGMRGGSATGGSYATNPEGEDWGETDFMFSPLMSPALTPQSVFTQASSVPTSSASYLPSGSLVSPAEFFSPLGSPAIMPQQFQDDPNLWQQQQQQQHRNSLQGLVDQTRALGFDTNLAGMQGLPPYGSPSSYFPQGQPGMSPRLGPNDAGQGTGAGSGRRGAGSKKARPSPLLKPTPDGGSLRRKKAGPSARSASISSANGARSATTSPFLGPTGSKPSSVASAQAQSQSQSSGSASGSQKATPPDENSNGINTPSPVDLAMGDVSTSSLGYQPELMGPPPPPSADSRRQSLNGPNDNEWVGPVTPASFMNLPSDFNVNDLSSLAPGLPPTIASSSQPYDVAVSNPLPPLPTLPALSSTSSAPPAIAPATARPKQLKSAPKPSADADLPVNGESSPVISATKGKGRAAAAGAAGRKATGKATTKPSPKVGATTKIKPLLANGAAPDAMNRLSSKSNYQNIVEGHGELLGLDAQAVTALNTSQAGAAGADTRRTSHKAAEQKRRDSLKARFEELRVLLPPIALSSNEERRPGEGNVGGQRSGSIDPDNPNRGVSKVALLRRSNEYMGMLLERVERRDVAIEALRLKMNELRSHLGIVEDDEEVPGLDLDNIDRDEREAGTMAFYENLSDDDEPTPKVARKASTARRKATAADGTAKTKATGARRSSRKALGAEEDIAMEVEV